jgi:hypothetical protein
VCPHHSLRAAETTAAAWCLTGWRNLGETDLENGGQSVDKRLVISSLDRSVRAAGNAGCQEGAFALADLRENSSGVVPKSAMPEISPEGLRLIKPIMDWELILGTAESPGAALACFIGGPWLHL